MGRVFSRSKAVLIDLIEKKMLCYIQNPQCPLLRTENSIDNYPQHLLPPAAHSAGSHFHYTLPSELARRPSQNRRYNHRSGVLRPSEKLADYRW